jgi:hypothetical protein
MANSKSSFLTAVVAMVLGIVIGVVGLAAVMQGLNPSAADVASEQDSIDQAPPGYGAR